jgi:hypothetical protein
MPCGVDILPKVCMLGSHVYPKGERAKERLELLQGTLDLLILRTLIFGPQHGQGIGRAIQQTSEDELLIEHGRPFIPLFSAWRRGVGLRPSGDPPPTIARRVFTRSPLRGESSSSARPPSGGD